MISSPATSWKHHKCRMHGSEALSNHARPLSLSLLQALQNSSWKIPCSRCLLSARCVNDFGSSAARALDLQRLFLAYALSCFKWPNFQEPSLHGRSPMLQGSCISGKPKVVCVGQQRNFQSSTGSLRLEVALLILKIDQLFDISQARMTTASNACRWP